MHFLHNLNADMLFITIFSFLLKKHTLGVGGFHVPTHMCHALFTWSSSQCSDIEHLCETGHIPSVYGEGLSWWMLIQGSARFGNKNRYLENKVKDI